MLGSKTYGLFKSDFNWGKYIYLDNTYWAPTICEAFSTYKQIHNFLNETEYLYYANRIIHNRIWLAGCGQFSHKSATLTSK